MEQETLHQRYLVVIALILCAVIIGYNAFYVPDASLSNVMVTVESSSQDSSSVNSSVQNSEEEYIPSAPSSSQGISKTESMESAQRPGSTGKINVNTATAQQLSEGLEGIGDVLAKRIVDYREENGRFQTISDIKNVAGIGDKLFERIRESITVGNLKK